MNNYVYNIKVNLQKNLINFYEWNQKDKIITLDKVKYFIVDDKLYQHIVNKEINVDSDFLVKIKNNDYICLFCSDIDIICTKFNKNGEIELISKLLLEEEYDLFDEIDFKNKEEFNYSIVENCNNYSFNTRKENEIVSSLISYIENIKDDNELINYLYYEWFNSNKNCKNKYEKLMNKIKGEYSSSHDKMFDLIKLLV